MKFYSIEIVQNHKGAPAASTNVATGEFLNVVFSDPNSLSPYWHIVTKFEIKGFYKRNWIFNFVLKYNVSDLFTVGFWTVRGTFCIQLSIFLFNINTF